MKPSKIANPRQIQERSLGRVVGQRQKRAVTSQELVAKQSSQTRNDVPAETRRIGPPQLPHDGSRSAIRSLFFEMTTAISATPIATQA